MEKLKIMTIFGTRPEAIKMAPLVKAIEADDRFESIVTVTAQHREMLDQVLKSFSIISDYDLDVMESGQTLTDVTSRVLRELDSIINETKPNIILVHGDTTTTFAASLAAFYHQIKIGHVEAGLRTRNKFSPFPEEMNRQLTDVLSDLYFAPTSESKKNLILERKDESKIFITGNTAIDAMKYTINSDYKNEILDSNVDKRIILMTMHRRENIGKPMINVFKAINRLVENFEDVLVVFPIHKNPKVRKLANDTLIESKRIKIIEPLDVVDFHNFVSRSYMILSDSGGVQEEAPSLGIPVLVLRDTTERPEGITAGTLKLVGTDEETVYSKAKSLLVNSQDYKSMSKAYNPYGDGKASIKILESIACDFGINVTKPIEFN